MVHRSLIPFYFLKHTNTKVPLSTTRQAEPQQWLSAATTTGRQRSGPKGPTLTTQGESGWKAQKPGSGATVPLCTTTQYLSQPPEP